MRRSKRPIVVLLACCLVWGISAPARADRAPFDEGAGGTSDHSSTYNVLGQDTGSASAEATADPATGRLTVTASATDTFIVGYNAITGTTSYATSNGNAWIRITKLLPPGEYVVKGRFTQALSTSEGEENTTNMGLPQCPAVTCLPYLIAAQAWTDARVYLSASCAGCTVSTTGSQWLNATPSTYTLVGAVTVPEGASRELTLTAALYGYSYASGESTTSLEASAIVDQLAVFRGEEEI